MIVLGVVLVKVKRSFEIKMSSIMVGWWEC